MRKFSKFYIMIMFCFLYFPIMYMVFYSFNSANNMFNFEGFSLVWYKELFQNKNLLIIIINTLIVALASSLFATIIGVLGAITINDIKNKTHQNILYSINTILLVSPDIIIAIALLSLFTIFSFKLGFVTVLIAHTVFGIPVVVIMVLARLQSMNHNLINAAKDLGANNYQVLDKVVIPLIKPGIIAGFFTAFTYSLDDFAVTFFVTGNGFTTLAVDIYSSARKGISMELNALSTLIFIITLLFAIGFYFIDNKGGK